MSASPAVSVCMPVYNAAPYVKIAVESLLAQRFGDFEILAVDDGSTDGSAEVLSAIRDPRLRVIRHVDNQGVIASRNTALSAARGEFVAVQDADDLSLPERLGRQVLFLRQHPAVGIVGVDFAKIDTEGRILSERHLPTTDSEIRQTLLHHNCFCSPSVMFRRGILDAAGPYREIAGPTGEDYDLFLRVLDRSEGAGVAEVLYHYRVNPDSLMSSAEPSLTIEVRENILALARARQETGRDPLTEQDSETLARLADLRERIRRHGPEPAKRRRGRYWRIIAEDLAEDGLTRRAAACAFRAILSDPGNAENWKCAFWTLTRSATGAHAAPPPIPRREME